MSFDVRTDCYTVYNLLKPSQPLGAIPLNHYDHYGWGQLTMTIPLGENFTFWPTNHQLETLSYPFHSYIKSSHAKAYLQNVCSTSIKSHTSRKIDQPPARIRMKASMQYKARKIRSTPPISQNTVAWWQQKSGRTKIIGSLFLAVN